MRSNNGTSTHSGSDFIIHAFENEIINLKLWSDSSWTCYLLESGQWRLWFVVRDANSRFVYCKAASLRNLTPHIPDIRIPCMVEILFSVPEFHILNAPRFVHLALQKFFPHAHEMYCYIPQKIRLRQQIVNHYWNRDDIMCFPTKTPINPPPP